MAYFVTDPSVFLYLHPLRSFKPQNINANLQHSLRQHQHRYQAITNRFILFPKNLRLMIKLIKPIGQFINISTKLMRRSLLKGILNSPIKPEIGRAHV